MDIRAAIHLIESAGMASPPPGFPQVLEDADQIAAYIVAQSSSHVDLDFTTDYFRGTKAILKLIPIEEIQEGSANVNVRSKAKEKRYAKLSLDTMPPLVVEKGKVMDGNHRFRVAAARGATALWCYDVVDAYGG